MSTFLELVELASLILNLMSFKNLGSKQTIVLHNCETDNQKYDLVNLFGCL